MRTPRHDDEGLIPGDPDSRWLAVVMHVTFFVLLATAMARFAQRHAGDVRTPWVITLAVVLGVLYIVGPAAVTAGRRNAPRLFWLGAAVAVWEVLVALAPSFAWVAVPLFYVALRQLPPRAAYVLVGVLTVFVIVAQLQLASRFDLDLVVGPVAVATLATAVFVYMERQTARQRVLIDDLVRTRRELAATERREGTLAERQRLAMEIHDTLAQGLSSQQMLLQAAERVWESDPDKARAHVRTAESVAEHNLTEARRFVHDLAPADLSRGGGLGEALHTLAARESGDRLTVRVHVDDGGRAPELPDRVQSALLRIAQGALANVREHSGAATAALTLTLLDDQAVLDVADDGHGFDPAALPDTPTGVRGHGLPAIRARVRQLGGTLTVESAPGEGTVLSAAIPLEGHR
ncbi:sensor histidine kinase [Streptomyces sp. TRM68416]|uniref:sensor histidine kinase n=1 Tax=Streptomyces sp. TRM68416 TaxID=2758412 RepID=UPI001661BFE7|nr:sensor histidine kinase [Streptomyces sp. TRM68416]MBD0844114.1 sensor histidine kinase [Streptomyces sp. TRM68416]